MKRTSRQVSTKEEKKTIKWAKSNTKSCQFEISNQIAEQNK